MSDKGRPYLALDDWRLAQEAAVAERFAAQRRVQLQAKTPGQQVYLDNIEAKTVTVCTGPGGTGKSWLSVGRGVQLLLARKYDRLILTRPLVNCGPGYGYLPGDKSEKIAPFLRPLLDILHEFISPEEVARRFREGSIEFFPLDDMRGSTLKKAFVVCDEAQNGLYHQLHMLGTRLGQGSKFVICGDTSRTQIDTSLRGPNPLKEVVRRIEAKGGHADVGVVKLTRADIVRHDLVRWLDETLGDEVVEEWDRVKCPACKAALWYVLEDGTDPDVVKCWQCQKTISLWGPDEEFSPQILANPTTGVADTFPQRP
jgi:phosphate starvation-inducible PhoH-like protein